MIPAFLLNLLPKAKLIGLVAGALAVAGIVLYAWHEHGAKVRAQEKAAALTVQLDQAIGVADANRAALERAKADQAAALVALETANANLSRRLVAATRLRTEIDDAPAQDDAPVAPVLRHALDGLRLQAGGKVGSGSPNRAPAGAGQPIDLRPGAGGP